MPVRSSISRRWPKGDGSSRKAPHTYGAYRWNERDEATTPVGGFRRSHLVGQLLVKASVAVIQMRGIDAPVAWLRPAGPAEVAEIRGVDE